MKLGIDTSSIEKIVLHLDAKVFEAPRTKLYSQKLLSFLEETLENEGKTLSDITEITTAIGPGSYTGLRVGMSVANTLSYLLKVPVNGKYTHKGETPELVYG
jgi:tRNA threonylcarbamoyladenosine biosynthesis protein TsaB